MEQTLETGPFELIQDDEVLYQMCQDWDTPTLLNMSEAYSRVYQVCDKEIQKRKKEYDDRINDLAEKIRKAFDIRFQKQIDEITVKFELISRFNNPKKTSANQIIEEVSPMYDLSSIPWLLPEIGYKEFSHGYRQWTRYSREFDKAKIDIKALAKNLIDQGYILYLEYYGN